MTLREHLEAIRDAWERNDKYDCGLDASTIGENAVSALEILPELEGLLRLMRDRCTCSKCAQSSAVAAQQDAVWMLALLVEPSA